MACQGAKLPKAEIGVKYAIAMEPVFGRGDPAVEELFDCGAGRGTRYGKELFAGAHPARGGVGCATGVVAAGVQPTPLA